jgi:hypothetical protein
MAELGAQLVEVLRASAARFVADNKEDVLALGEDAVRAILTGALVAKRVIAVPVLSASPSAAEIAEREEVVAAFSRQAQLVAAAEKADAVRAKAVRARALDLAGQVGVKVGGVLLGALAGALVK